MSDFDTGIPNIRVIIREQDDQTLVVDVPSIVVKVENGPDYNVNIKPSTKTTIRTGSIFSIAEFAYSALSSSYALSASYAINVTQDFTGSVTVTGSLGVLGDTQLTGSLGITDNLTVHGILSAEQLLVSSSIIYESGSTKFGDSPDDTHQFTGSVLVAGPISASSITGSFKGDGSQLTGLVTDLRISGSSGSDTLSLLTDDLTVVGNNGIVTTVTDNTITIDVPNTLTASLFGTASFATIADNITIINAGIYPTGSDGYIIPSPSGGLSYITSASYAYTASYALYAANGGGGGGGGTSGTSGRNGSSGTSGRTGTSGTSGTNGYSGTAGSSGTSGISGTDGTSGTSGTSGESGTSGIDGTSGTAGTSGINGDRYETTSSTSQSITTGSKTFTLDDNGLAYTNGQTVIIARTSDYSTRLEGIVTNYNDGIYQLTINVTSTFGSGGPYTDWQVNVGGVPGQSGSSGTSGSSGSSGENGTSGMDGTSGSSGQSGTSGTSGSSGTSGTSGIGGTSGTSGISGTSGTSGINGTSGTSGASGTSGTAGTSGTSPELSSGVVSSSVQILNYNIFATTGSNNFVGNQTITGSLTVSGSSTFSNIGPTILSGNLNVTNDILINGVPYDAHLATTGSNTFVGEQIVSGGIVFEGDASILIDKGEIDITAGVYNGTGSRVLIANYLGDHQLIINEDGIQASALTVAGGIIGTLIGTSSNAISASTAIFANTASVATSITFIPVSSSYATTASYIDGGLY